MWSRIVLIMALAIAAVVSQAVGSVNADTPVTAHCGGLEAERPVGLDLARAKQKEALARQHADRRAGDVTINALGKLLMITFQEQANDYYCGPASAWMVNNWNGPHFYGRTTSLNEGWALTQANLAHSSYLNTTTNGTTYGLTTWGKALNGWWNGSQYGWYELTSSPSTATFKANMMLDIDYDRPFVIDVHISEGTCYLAGYARYTDYMHYLAVHGYGSYGDVTTYSDPYETGNGSLGRHDVSTSGLNPCLQDRGMIW